MTLIELRYIVAVARERHFGRAAESCFVSQPTLSVAVKKLEDELGVNLFERGVGEVTITSVGQQVVTQAQRVLEEVETVKQLARQGTDPLTEPLRVGAIYTVGPYLFPHLVSIITDRAPKMPLLIEENFTAVLSERLKRGELDVIVISQPFNEPGIVVSPLYDEPFVLLLPAAHPWNQQELVTVEEVGRENVLLLGAGHCFRDQVLRVCPTCLQPSTGEGASQHSLEGSSLETIRYMVASGVGVTVLPCTAAGADRFSERLLSIRRFAGKPPQRRVALAWRKSFPRPQAVDVLKRAIMACNLSCVNSCDESA